MIVQPSASRRRFLATGALSLGAFAVVPGRAKAAQFEFKFASNQPFDNPATIRHREMWTAIEHESGGRIHTQVFANSMLGGDGAMLSQLRVGAIDFNFPTGGLLSSVVPSAGITYLGMAFKDTNEAIRAHDGPLGDFIRADSAAKGLFLLPGIWDAGMTQIGSTTRALRNVEDMRGFKVRTIPSKISVDYYKELGANPTPLDFKEVYPSLQTHLIDGEAGPITSLETGKFYEINKFMNIGNFAWSANWIAVNPDSWKRLPSDLQELVQRNGRKYGLLQRQDSRTVTVTLTEKMRARGLTIVSPIDPAPFRDRLGRYYTDYAAQFGPTEWNLLKSAVSGTLP